MDFGRYSAVKNYFAALIQSLFATDSAGHTWRSVCCMVSVIILVFFS